MVSIRKRREWTSADLRQSLLLDVDHARAALDSAVSAAGELEQRAARDGPPIDHEAWQLATLLISECIDALQLAERTAQTVT